MSFVIFDTEYTSWKGCQENGWHGNQKKEIVQISALKVSENLRVLAEFNVLCKPQINPILSDYFIDLTHITNAQINKKGKCFADAYKRFEAFVGKNKCYSHAWGADFFHKSDGEILNENIVLYKLPKPQEIAYRNIAPVFAKLYAKHNIPVKNQTSGQIVQILGIENKLKKLELNKHNALYDVYSILESLKYFYPQSVELINFFENK